MRIWIDIEDANGNKLGDGPIRTATGWERTRRLDRAGSFAFGMPAGDPRSDLVRIKRVARCWTVAGGQVLELGAGIIDKIETGLDAKGIPLLKISGDDLLRELANRTVGELALYESRWLHPSVSVIDNFGSVDELPHTNDGLVGDTGTADEVELTSATDIFWHVADPLPFSGLHIVMGSTKNTVVEALVVQYFNGATAAWTALTVVDETAVGGAPLAQSGDVLWTIPADWGPREGYALYEVRVNGAALDKVDIADVAIRRDEPMDAALDRVLSVVAGSGWALDTELGYDSISRSEQTEPPSVIRGEFHFVGIVDDGVSDVFGGWTNMAVDDANGDTVEGTYTAMDQDDSLSQSALKIGHTSGDPSPWLFYETETTLAEGTDYLLSFWTCGDGNAQGRFRVQDISHLVSGLSAIKQYLTPLTPTGVTTKVWTEVRCAFTTPPGCTAVLVALYGADEDVALGEVYFDNVNLQKRVGGEVYLQTAGESVLETLIRIGEQTGEHFILSPTGRRVAWLRDDVRELNLQAVAAGGIAAEGNADALLITGVSEVQDGYELATRVYAHGTGQGTFRVTLANATRPLPAGWSLNKAENYLCYDTAEAVLGRIDRVLDWPDVGQVGSGPEAERFASNALLDRAYNWLVRHSATDTARVTGNVPRSYALAVTKCERLILPGFKLRLSYSRHVAGYTAVDVDADLWVLAATERIDGNGLQTVGLVVSTVDVWPEREDEVLADEMRRARQGRAYG